MEKPIEEICSEAKDFLTTLVNEMDLDLSVTSKITSEGCLLDLSGPDSGYTLSENAELLDAFETILFQIYGRQIDREQRIICDAEGFRQARKAELYAMARFAGNQVRKNGTPFTFGVLNSTERRVIHTALQADEDLESESVGAGRERRLQVRLK
jgi:spoIIIJ-associated protein